MRKIITGLFIVSFIFLSYVANAENSFTTALRTCSKYSQNGGATNEKDYYNISVTLEKTKKGCEYKEKIYQASGYQMLTCNFKTEHLGLIADSMDRFTTAYKKEIDKNKIYEAKLTNNAEIFENYLINPKYCKVTMSKNK